MHPEAAPEMSFITPFPWLRTQSHKYTTCKRTMKRPMRCSTPQPAQPPQGREDDEVPLELVEGYLENAKVRPKIDIDADEYMLMWKLRLMLHEDDFNKIFDPNSRRIGVVRVGLERLHDGNVAICQYGRYTSLIFEYEGNLLAWDTCLLPFDKP